MQYEYPPLSDRIQSIFIDQIFIITLMFVSTSILDKYEDAPDWIRIVLFFGIWAIYEPICMIFGCTLGNYFKRIRSRKFSDPTKRMNIFQSYLRYIIKIMLGWLSFLTINMNKEKRAIHDLAASTVMIKV
jgi:uncharacterized RDD family membrane protein YckC